MRVRRLVRAGALLGALLVGARAQGADAPGLTLTAPASVIGDGETVVTVSLVAAPPTLASAPADVRVTASAGTVRAVRLAEQGRFDIDYLPPSVARDRPVQIEAATVRGAVAARPASIVVTRPVQKGQSSTGGPLDLRVPALYVLGTDDPRDVSVRKPASGKVVLKTNVGGISDAREDADGRLHATYTPPADKFPHVAIVVAMSDDGVLLDWSSIPLHGVPQVKLTSAPNATVRAKVGSRVFGPFRADASGQTSIDVLAPPGATTAEGVETDSRGNDHPIQLPLGAPPFDHGFAVCAPDGERVVLFAVDSAGVAAGGVTWRAKSSRGRVLTPVAVGPGAYEARLEIPEDVAVDEQVDIEVEATDRQRYGAKCGCPVVGDPPTGIELRLDPPAYVEGSGRPIQIVAALRYAGKRRPRPVTIEAEATLGRVHSVQVRSPTEITATWELPDRLGDARQARVSVRTRARPAIGAEAVLELGAQPAAAAPARDGWMRAWARAGYTSNLGRVQSPMVAGGAAARLPWLERAVALGVEIGYWGNRSTQADARNGETVRTSVSVVPLTVRATFERRFGRVVPYAGAALGAAFTQTGVRSPTAGDVRQHDAVLGAGVVGGAGTDVGPGRAGLELGYFGSGVNNAIVSGNCGGWQLTAGYQLDL